MGKFNLEKTDISPLELNAYYTEILKFVPHLVYWVDTNDRLQGCNDNFRQLLKISDVHKFSKNVHSSLINALHLSDAESKRYQQNNKDVMSSNLGKHNVSLQGREQNSYLCDYNPLHDLNGQVIGLMIVIMSATHHDLKQPLTLDHPPRTLIIEDNTVALEIEKSILGHLGCQVDTAKSAQEAQDLFQPGKYDLAILDIELGDSTGYVLTRILRELEKNTHHHVPIIALTSHGAERVKFYSDGKNMDGALTKPLTIEQATQLVDKFVYQKDVSVNGLMHA